MDLGPWLPDLVPYGHEGLTICQNVYPAANGYRPVRNVSQLTNALSVTWRGGGSFIGLDGTVATLAGTDSGLYSYSGTAWTLRQSGTYSGKWQFAQYGGTVIGVNGAAPVKFTIPTSAGALLGGSPPSATMIAIVRDQVFLAGDPAANSTVYWSAINNSEGWTVGAAQADKQLLPDGGPITGMAGGEYGLVFQETAIHRFSYVGTPLIYQRDKISDGIGCITPGALATFGRMSFFLSNRGFYSITDGGLTAIGENQVNDWFAQQYARADIIANIRATVDPKRTLAIWSMPDCLILYNWVLQRWSYVSLPGLVGLSTGINAGVSLDALDALYPSGIDSIPVSLDAPIFAGGDPMLTVVLTDNRVYALGGDYLAATLQSPLLEPITGRTARVRRARVYGDPVSGVMLTVGSAARQGDVLVDTSSNTITASGYMPIRFSDQFMRYRVDVAAGTAWTYLSGINFDMAAGGSY